MIEGMPGIVMAIMEFIVKKDMSSSWFQINWIRQQRKMFNGVLFTKFILPPLKNDDTDFSIPFSLS
jgi:hypothetical protein